MKANPFALLDHQQTSGARLALSNGDCFESLHLPRSASDGTQLGKSIERLGSYEWKLHLQDDRGILAQTQHFEHLHVAARFLLLFPSVPELLRGVAPIWGSNILQGLVELGGGVCLLAIVEPAGPLLVGPPPVLPVRAEQTVAIRVHVRGLSLFRNHARVVDQHSVPFVATVVLHRNDGADSLGGRNEAPVPNVPGELDRKCSLLDVLLHSGPTDGNSAVYDRFQLWENARRRFRGHWEDRGQQQCHLRFDISRKMLVRGFRS